MWKIFCAGRWICLLMLAGVMLPTESKGKKKADLRFLDDDTHPGDLQAFSVQETCCTGGMTQLLKPIIKCVKPKRGCNSKYYVVQVKGGNFRCMNLDSEWMKEQIESGKVTCE